ncbi:sugar phosphate isomerase/epimerase family protein [Geodermatophilus amargosae]|uniref:sugar phosphate isomerase/epimerase family protein n=1 Tax=Geodermatophilus amargosae TaxID=1296565 RepID=UPI0034DF6915
MLVAAVSSVLFVGLVGTASAAPPSGAHDGSDCVGRTIPTSKISIQLWTFAEYIGSGTDADTQARLEEVLRRLAAMGYRNVEPFSLSGLTAEQFRALLDQYGLEAPARHVDVRTPTDPADIGQVLEENRVLGVEYFGSGATPNLATEAEWIAYARYLDAVGEQARKAGQTLMVHNHDWEFTDVFGDRTAYDVLMAYTERRNVVFQLDLYWATFAGADPVELIERYGNRIRLFHVKDMRASDRRIEIVGEGIIDFPAIFAAAGGGIRYYVVEHDPRFGDPTFDPFEAAEVGFEYLTCRRD